MKMADLFDTTTTATTTSEQTQDPRRAAFEALKRRKAEAKAKAEAEQKAAQKDAPKAAQTQEATPAAPAPSKAHMSLRALALALIKSPIKASPLCAAHALYLCEVWKGAPAAPASWKDFLVTPASREVLTISAVYAHISAPVRAALKAALANIPEDLTAEETDIYDVEDFLSEDATEEDAEELADFLHTYFAHPSIKERLATLKTLAQLQTTFSDNVFCKNIAGSKAFQACSCLEEAARGALSKLSPAMRGLPEELKAELIFHRAGHEVSGSRAGAGCALSLDELK